MSKETSAVDPVRFGLRVERLWVWKVGHDICACEGSRPAHDAVEYMRVLSRQEVDKLAGDGVDVQQYINSLLRTIEGQRRHIDRLISTMVPKDYDDE